MQVTAVSTGKVLEHRQVEHRDRVKKIMTRKPGSSVTLDNRPPEAVATAAFNPRKISVKMHLSHAREQDNKSMLQRISRILTAPSSINDDDYIKMKKLCGSLAQSGRSKYESDLRVKNNKKFFANLKRVPGIYNARQWEHEYRHQLANQERFMRQVKYKRPPDFVDPFATPERSQTSPSSHSKGVGGTRRPRTTGDSADLTEEELLMLLEDGDEGLEAIGEEGEEDLEEDEEEEGGGAGANGAAGGTVRSASHVHRIRAQAAAAKDARGGGRKLPPIATDKRALRPSSSPVQRPPRSADGAKRATSASSTADFGFDNPREREEKAARRLSRRGKSPPEEHSAAPIRAWNAGDDDGSDSDDDDDNDDESPEWGDGFDLKKSLKHVARDRLPGLDNSPSAPPSAETTPRGAARLSKHRASVIAHRPSASPTDNVDKPTQKSGTTSRGGKKRASTAHRAELTQLDREIRIYTVEMDQDSASIAAGDGSPEGVSSALSPGAMIPGVSTFATTPRESECRSFYNARAEIKCWLLMEMKTLLVRVYVPDAFPLIDVQAQISLRDLASNKGVTVDNLMTDFKTLDAIAREIISEVELTVEDESVAQAAAAKRKKATLKGRSGSESGGEEEVEGRKGAKGKPTRRTRLVVHMARKGRRRHRSTAEAFLDEQFLSHVSPPGSAASDRAGQRQARDSSPYKSRLAEPEPERLEVARVMRVPVTVMVPSAKAMRQLGGVRKPSSQHLNAAAPSADGPTVDGLRRAPSGGLTPADASPPADSTSEGIILTSRRPSFDASTGAGVAGSTAGKKTGKQEPRGSTAFVKQLPKHQQVEALVRVSTIKPGSSAAVVDKVSLLITFTEPTRDNFGDKVAVKVGEEVSLTVGLPSIMQTDDELILEFFDNLLEGLYVQHNSSINANTAYVSFREPPPLA